jgi:hypothetical protein
VSVIPYLFLFTKWPSDKAAEVVKKAIEGVNKFPRDESAWDDLTPGNAIKATGDGVETISVLNVKKGRLEEAYFHTQKVANFYATAIQGFEYRIEVWSNAEEAYGSIGQKPPG